MNGKRVTGNRETRIRNQESGIRSQEPGIGVWEQDYNGYPYNNFKIADDRR